jgi:hypothetical protein
MVNFFNLSFVKRTPPPTTDQTYLYDKNGTIFKFIKPTKANKRAYAELKAAIPNITPYKRYLIKKPGKIFFGFEPTVIFLISSASE